MFFEERLFYRISYSQLVDYMATNGKIRNIRRSVAFSIQDPFLPTYRICFHLPNKIFPKNGILLKEVLIPKLLNKSFGSFFISIDILLSHTGCFIKSIILPLLCLHNPGDFTFCIFLHLRQYVFV